MSPDVGSAVKVMGPMPLVVELAARSDVTAADAPEMPPEFCRANETPGHAITERFCTFIESDQLVPDPEMLHPAGASMEISSGLNIRLKVGFDAEFA